MDDVPANVHESIFTSIYEANHWGSTVSRSGPGSESETTAVIRMEVPKLLRSLGAESLLDIPCGDFGWLRQASLPIQNYIGGDIVRELIERLQVELENHALGYSCTFLHLNLLADDLPKVDVVLCRDCLVHFSYASIFAAIQNLVRSGSTYLLTTTFTGRTANRESRDGGWRTLNLELPPFHFPPPLQLINEACPEGDGRYADKSLGLWRLADLGKLTFQAPPQKPGN
ncbi:MAG: class I SAM-dependent methyltransferase [Chthoniobacterales bacterium]